MSLILWPRRKRVWGFGEYKVWETALQLGMLCINYVPAKQRGGVSHHVSETSLSCTRVTMDINISPSCSSSSPSVRCLSKKCRQTGGLQNVLSISVALSPPQEPEVLTPASSSSRLQSPTCPFLPRSFRITIY